ncbi:MAG TPA: CARDB domain-containing protein [Sandaracinaceae bacterium LLY-WYZ-13_1]|nr:CARDB domain-containing protein [Sandaracinaceae bacterium LLY-WYZ-13_1]
MRTRAGALLCALCLSGCTAIFSVDDYEVGDPDVDAGPSETDAGEGGSDGGPDEDDAGATDAGPAEDAGPPVDGGVDAGPPARCTEVAHGCDLIISCSMPETITGSGDSVRVPYSVTNLGMLSGAGPFDVTVELARPDGSYVEVTTDRFAGIVEPLGTGMDEASFVAPDWIRNGSTDLRCVLDSSDEVPETDESNNQSDTSFVASGLPDLQIISPSIPGSPGSTFTVRFDLRNAGPTAAGPFTYLISAGGAGGGGTCRIVSISDLSAGTTRSESETINLSADCGGGFPPGDGTVFINVDPGAGGGDVMESNEDNNTFTRNVTW